MRRVLVIPLAMLGLALLAVRWSASHADAPADFVFINRGEVKTLDPTVMSWLQDIRVAYGLWEGLLALDPQTLRPVPGCATDYDLSADATVYTFHLRPSARWSNGDPVRAGDFIFAWKRMLDEGGDYVDLYRYIHGAAAYRAAVAAGADADFSTVGIAAPDPLTLRVTLDNPVSYFPYLCAFPSFFPLHEPSMRPFRRDPNNPRLGYRPEFTHPESLVGNGPYRLKTWEFKRRMRLEAADTYWDRAHIRSRTIDILSFDDGRTAFLKYNSGGVDWLSDLSAELAADMRGRGYKDLHIFPGFGTYFYSVNCQGTLADGRPNPFADVRVRRAFAMAIDKKPIVDKITRLGQPVATTFIPPDAFADYHPPQGLPCDPQQARQLLTEAGYGGGYRFPTVTILYNTEDDLHHYIAQYLRRQWADELGVDVELQGVEVKTFGTWLHGKKYMLARASWIGDYPDPSTFTDKYLSGSDNNDSGWSNADYDRLCDEAARQPDSAKRMELLERAEHILCEEVPIIPLFHYVNAYMFRDNVHGVPLDPRNMVMLKGVYRDAGGP